MKTLDEVVVGGRVRCVDPNSEKHFNREGTVEGKADYFMTDMGFGIQQDVAYVKWDGEAEAKFCGIECIESSGEGRVIEITDATLNAFQEAVPNLLAEHEVRNGLTAALHSLGFKIKGLIDCADPGKCRGCPGCQGVKF